MIKLQIKAKEKHRKITFPKKFYIKNFIEGGQTILDPLSMHLIPNYLILYLIIQNLYYELPTLKVQEGC